METMSLGCIGRCHPDKSFWFIVAFYKGTCKLMVGLFRVLDATVSIYQAEGTLEVAINIIHVDVVHRIPPHVYRSMDVNRS